MGNVGSKVLAFLVDDWVNTHAPDLVFIETVVNDGDAVLETNDETGVRRALEGEPLICKRQASKYLRSTFAWLLRSGVLFNAVQVLCGVSGLRTLRWRSCSYITSCETTCLLRAARVRRYASQVRFVVNRRPHDTLDSRDEHDE
jgi:hypothetical protein